MIFRYLTLFSLSLLSLHAQSTLGVVLGNVADPTGAVITGASIKLVNTSENVTRSMLSTESGDYEFQNVKSGVYSVEVSKPGFRAFAARGVTLVARQTLRVNVGLEVGEIAQVVEVTTDAGVIATDSHCGRLQPDSGEGRLAARSVKRKRRDSSSDGMPVAAAARTSPRKA